MSSARPSHFRRPAHWDLTELEKAELRVVHFYDMYKGALDQNRWWATRGAAIAFWLGVVVGVVLMALVAKVGHHYALV